MSKVLGFSIESTLKQRVEKMLGMNLECPIEFGQSVSEKMPTIYSEADKYNEMLRINVQSVEADYMELAIWVGGKLVSYSSINVKSKRGSHRSIEVGIPLDFFKSDFVLSLESTIPLENHRQKIEISGNSDKLSYLYARQYFEGHKCVHCNVIDEPTADVTNLLEKLQECNKK